jgi:UPF0716 protein FxsA
VLSRIFLLLVLLPLIEIVVLVWIASKTSAVFVLLLVLGTGILGLTLMRRQSLQTWRRLSVDMESGRMPAESLVDSVLVLVAGGLLVLPGVLTDVAAIALLFPPSRRAIKSLFGLWLQSRIATMRFEAHGSRFADHDQIIDVKVIESPPQQLPP